MCNYASIITYLHSKHDVHLKKSYNIFKRNNLKHHKTRKFYHKHGKLRHLSA